MKSIYNDRVRLHADGRVEHWDADLATYRPGWGPYAHQARIGPEAAIIDAWERDMTNHPRLCACGSGSDPHYSRINNTPLCRGCAEEATEDHALDRAYDETLP
jgi:hypothetical protein